MSGIGFMVVFVGAGLGACLRWVLALWLNPLLPTLPLGTLAANLVGGLLIGIAGACLGPGGLTAPEWRLFAVTGFLGGLTTFSTFSAEVVGLIERQQHAWALATASTHLAGSLALTALGLLLGRACMGAR
ncbi:fluoride efflux transporter CrcB [Aquincola sp. S2]|uniref:Fluoride-specific ion channel FluC n=1 Tax=Pseudaquabacterium terrae TaxID=2732868 RepID=A0ABX2EAP0_9BURK|nr:fluoride efflux transporter CrcB [Aquabacterium terrae]NRF65626.1 fluoride efflux transporter CrcB [Aquabacterium terrae]